MKREWELVQNVPTMVHKPIVTKSYTKDHCFLPGPAISLLNHNKCYVIKTSEKGILLYIHNTEGMETVDKSMSKLASCIITCLISSQRWLCLLLGM